MKSRTRIGLIKDRIKKLSKRNKKKVRLARIPKSEAPSMRKNNLNKVEKKYIFTNEHFKNLNEEQIKCINYHDGPLLVLAGAGTGKTRVITLRLLKILERHQSQISLDEILIVTFTNKAVQEMKDRIVGLLEEYNDLWLGTFHSICAKILRLHTEWLKLNKNFVIINQEDQKSILEKLAAESPCDEVEIGNAIKTISIWKNKGLFPSEVQVFLSQELKCKKLYKLYHNKLIKLNAVDFDDLLLLCNKLFQNQSSVLKIYQQKFRYIMVDEFQDTNSAQYLWLKLLASQHRNICLMGDENQSIYKFRGAVVQNIVHFQNQFQDCKTLFLEQNYRSNSSIIKAASELIKNNKHQSGKNLWTKEKS